MQESSRSRAALLGAALALTLPAVAGAQSAAATNP
jgi:hypothetical protein